jgi:cell division protein FtsZ
MFSRLIDALRTLEIDFDGESIADAIWLSHQMRVGMPIDPGSIQAIDNSDPVHGTSEIKNRLPSASIDNANVQLQSTDPTAGLLAHDPESVDLDRHSIRLPTPRTLSDGLHAALGPLATRDPRPSFKIDVEATVESFATSGVWIEQHAPGERRWLHASLIIETGPQSPIWQSTLNEFFQLLKERGAFRTVRRQELFKDPDGMARLRLVDGDYAHDAWHAPWRRDEVIIIASDFVSADWSSAFGRCVEHWRKTNHVLLLHLMPRRLWGRTWTGVPELLVSGQSPGGDSSSLLISAVAPRYGRRKPLVAPLATPIAGLLPQDLRAWSAVLVAQPGRTLAIGLATRLKVAQTPLPLSTPRMPENLVTAFKANASPLCIKLATYLSLTAPLTFQMMQWVQIAMVPDASTTELAEFFFSGLVEIKLPATNPTDVVYDFIPGVRELLERGISILEAIEVQQAVGAKLQLYDWNSGAPGSAVDVQLLAERPDIPARQRMFAEVSANYLRRAGHNPSLENRWNAQAQFAFLEPAQVAQKVAARLTPTEYIVQQVLISSNDIRRTWLVFCTESLVVVEDDEKTRQAQQAIQLILPLQEVSPIRISMGLGEGVGQVFFGTHPRPWHYNENLFTKNDPIEQVVSNAVKKSKAKADLHLALRRAANDRRRFTKIDHAASFFRTYNQSIDSSFGVPDLISLTPPHLGSDGNTMHVLYASRDALNMSSDALLFESNLNLGASPSAVSRYNRVVRFGFGRPIVLFNVSNVHKSLRVITPHDFYKEDKWTIENDVVQHMAHHHPEVDGICWQLEGERTPRLACFLVDRILNDLIVYEVDALNHYGEYSKVTQQAYIRGRNYLAHGNYHEAIEFFNVVLKSIGPRSKLFETALAQRGQAYLAIGRFQDAQDDFETLLDRSELSSSITVRTALKGLETIKQQTSVSRPPSVPMQLADDTKNDVYKAISVKIVAVGDEAVSSIGSASREKFPNCEVVAIASSAAMLAASSADLKIRFASMHDNSSSLSPPDMRKRRQVQREIEKTLDGSSLVFVVTSSGQGADFSVAAMVANIAKRHYALTITFFSSPRLRSEKTTTQASRRALTQLLHQVDSVILTERARLRSTYADKSNAALSFLSNTLVTDTISAITSIIDAPGNINVDFADVRAILGVSRVAYVGVGSGTGPERARRAAENALASAFMGVSEEKKAAGLLIVVTADRSLKGREIKEIMAVIRSTAKPDASIAQGISYDDTIADQIRVTIIAVGDASSRIDFI